MRMLRRKVVVARGVKMHSRHNQRLCASGLILHTRRRHGRGPDLAGIRGRPF